MNVDNYASQIAGIIVRDISTDFTGFGLVLVTEDLSKLPVAPLLDDEISQHSIESISALCEFLLTISKSNDVRHDGFHFYNVKNKVLTISQYFSPEIPLSMEGILRNVGARLRTAQYGSSISAVLGIITINSDKNVYLAKDGKIIHMEAK